MAKRMLDCVTSDLVTFKKEDWLSKMCIRDRDTVDELLDAGILRRIQ